MKEPKFLYYRKIIFYFHYLSQYRSDSVDSAVTSLHDFVTTVVAINDDLSMRVLLEIANIVGCFSVVIEKIIEIIEGGEMFVT